ncbi:MAG TPA: MBL fold metallo-hydrolase [Verrucomicrobiae bacterium]|nr:MBL fold metallo-hydrolase [Verrucomicrobiae bacterium]
MQFTILGSGSAGNCAYLETPETRVLIDCGFSAKQIRQRLASIGRTPENLTGILVTHEHIDHIHGLGVLAHKLNIPVYCNRATHDAIRFQFNVKIDCRLFATGGSFDLGDVHVETFSIPHDAQDPVGYVLRAGSASVAFLTDLGHMTKLVTERVRTANVLVLEANHDVKLLQDCPHRPWSLKQRILGRHGHLSNAAAADAIADVMSANLQHLFLGHLSRECNKPALAHAAVMQRLEQIGASHLPTTVASQDTPCPTLSL